MKKKILTVFIGLTLILTMVFSALPGCGGEQPAPTPTLPPGAEGDGVVKMTWQHNLPANDPLYFLAEKAANDIKVGTGGRLDIEIVPSGTVCGNLEVLDAVGSGKLDMGTVYDSIHGEIDPRFYVVGNLPAGMTLDESMCWLVEDQWAEQGGGWQLAKDLYAEHNCEWLFFSFGPPLMDYLSTKKLESNTDYKGVKVRATGLVAKVLQEPEFGAVVSDQAEADIYSALEKGDIEAAFLYGPEYNVGMNLHKVAKYAGFPGMQAQMRTTGLLMNSDKYIMLTEDIQNYLKWAFQTFAVHTYAYKVMNDAAAWHEMKDAGVEMVIQNEECQIAWEQASWRLMDEIAAKDAKFKKVWDLWRSMVRMLRPYMKMQLPNYEDIPGVEPKYG